MIIRGIGSSLGGAQIANPLADPTLELHFGSTIIASNDNWQETQSAAIRATGIAPENDLESAIIATLDPGPYTAVLAGKNAGTGVGLVEVYDLDPAADSNLGNISTSRELPRGTGSGVIEAHHVIGVRMGEDDGIHLPDVFAQALGAEIGPGINDKGAFRRLEMNRSARPIVTRMVRAADRAQSQRIMGTPCEVPVPRKVR